MTLSVLSKNSFCFSASCFSRRFWHCRDDDNGLRHRPVVGDREVDLRGMPGRRQRLEPLQRTARKLHGRAAGGQIHNTHIAPPDPLADAGAERLGARLLRREALGVGLDAILAAFGLRAFGFGEDAVEKAIAVPLDYLADTARVDDVVANAEDHAASPFARERPRSIAVRILRTMLSRPSKIDSPIM